MSGRNKEAVAVQERGTSWNKRLAAWAGLVAIGLVTAGPADAAQAPVPPTTAWADVVVQGVDGDAARHAVVAVGGHVERRLAVIDGVSAAVPADQIDELAADRDVVSVTPDSGLASLGDRWNPGGSDAGAMTNVVRTTGATAAHRRGVTGAGIDVAIIDSGLVPVEGLDQPDKVVFGPDLSFDSQSDDRRHLDAFGHGTHLGGIIAGQGDGFTGMAPGARLVSVKVASANGATDVSQVIAAIDWVVQHHDDPGLNIRVINLAYGTDSTQSAALDPLAHAAEVAWRNGIVVVVAAGNEGSAATRLRNPASDPWVLAVGATDHAGTPGGRDDRVARFSSRGSAERGPDLVAPGRSIVSLRSPGSVVDTQNPEAQVGRRFFRGSGTSQATAVAAGAAALVLQDRPELGPDQVKAVLTGSAAPVRGDRTAKGAGQLDVRAALRADTPTSAQSHVAGSGLGSLEAARGSVHVVDANGVALTGEQDIFGTAWDPTNHAALAKGRAAWDGGTWNGQSWSGQSWSGQSWSGQSWSGQSWSGQSWSGQSWSGQSWSGQSWSGQSWSGQSWSGQSWSTVLWGD